MRYSRLLLAVAASVACGGSTSPTASSSGTTTPTSSASDVPAVYKVFANSVTNGVTVKVDGSTIVISSTGLPDHKSPYFGVGNAQYESYNGTNARFVINPNSIRSQQLVFRIPMTQSPLATPSPTPLGPIGIAVNGVPIFNQYAANNQPLTNEADSFDQYGGHPQQSGMYHYHVEPSWLTRTSREAMVGVLLDGYPVYGPMENGQLVSSASLDAAHGHTGATKEFPLGIYHYHTTADAPYINGSGFHGSPGTVSQ